MSMKIPGVAVALLAVLAGLAASAAPARGAQAQPPLGLPKGESVLFALQAESGSLVRGSGRSATLTLRRAARSTVWFADRPSRDAGRVSTRALVRSWVRLGFLADRPNAVLTTSGKGARETVIELGRPRLNSRTRTLQLPVRILGRRSAGLAKRFGAASLFIDNAIAGTDEGCGQAGGLKMFPKGVIPGTAGYIPADGAMFAAAAYPDLFRALGTRFGGDGTTFRVPNVPAPDGLHAVICRSGERPADCLIGNMMLVAQESAVAGHVLAAGQQLNIADRPRMFDLLQADYGGDGRSTFAVPAMPAPPGMSWQICADGEAPSRYGGAMVSTQDLSEVAYWALGSEYFAPTGWGFTWGQLLPTSQNTALFSLFSADFGGNGKTTFQLPRIADPMPGVHAEIALHGRYPQRL
jgi:microcystin-dependent protein